MPSILVHPETNVFALSRALREAGQNLALVSDGTRTWLCPPDELPAGCTQIHVATPAGPADITRRSTVELLQAQGLLAATLLREVR